MQFRDTHVLLVDYNERTRDKFDHLFSQSGAIAHPCSDRIDAIGKLWELVNKGISPRAIITNWILEDEAAREFYQKIKREVDMTSANLLKNAKVMDEEKAEENRTILICYTDKPKEATIALAKLELLDTVIVVNMQNTTIEELVQILMRDERTKIVEYFREEVKTDSFTREINESQPISGID